MGLKDGKEYLATRPPYTPSPLTEQMQKTIGSFLSLGDLAEAMQEQDYTIKEEMEILLGIVRDSENPKQQLAAIKMLNDRRMELAKMTGLLVTASQSQEGEDGIRRTLSTSVVANALQTAQLHPSQKYEAMMKEEQAPNSERIRDDGEGRSNSQDAGSETVICGTDAETEEGWRPEHPDIGPLETDPGCTGTDDDVSGDEDSGGSDPSGPRPIVNQPPVDSNSLPGLAGITRRKTVADEDSPGG